MHYDFYRYNNIKFKTKEELPELWNRAINDVDFYIADLLNKLKIDVDFLYTTNVGIMKFESTSFKSILWDVSFWAMYLKYLEFVFWAEHECSRTYKSKQYNTKVVNTPLKMKYNIHKNEDLLDANRLVFLPCIFEYLAYQFYNDVDISYMFSLLRNENMCQMKHSASEELIQEYVDYLSEQLLFAKLFCVCHEIYHLKILSPCGMERNVYSQRIIHNLMVYTQDEKFAKFLSHDPKLIFDTRTRIESFNIEDPLFDELYADAAALDLIDTLVNYKKHFVFKFEHFVKAMRTTIENFYAFNTLTYDLSTIWKDNFEREYGHISDNVYQERIHKRDVEGTIRGLIFPMILWNQLDLFTTERGFSLIPTKRRRVSVRNEMIHFFNIAYNDTIKNQILNARKIGFKKGVLSLGTARDILVGWDDLKNYPYATINDLFLGGKDDENNYVMFVRGY